MIATMVSSRYRMVFTASLVIMAGSGAMVLARSTQLLAAWIRERGRFPGWQAALAWGLALSGLALSWLPVAPRYSYSEEWAYLGEAYLAVGDRARAAECLRRAREEDPHDPLALMGLARMAWLGGDLATAEELFLAALAGNPHSSLVKLKLGQFYYQKGEKDKAMVLVEGAVRNRPGWVVGLYALAVMCADRGDVERARELLDRIYSLRPAFDPGDDLLAKIGRERRPARGKP
jgi:tetratricopeptide (TPR) repeat protein